MTNVIVNDFVSAEGLLPHPVSTAGELLLAVVMLAIGWGLGQIVSWAIHRARERHSELADHPGLIFAGQLARVAVWLMSLLIYSNLVPQLNASVDPSNPMGMIFYAALTTLVALVIGRALKLAIHRVLEKRGESADQTGVRFLGQLSWVLVWVMAFVSYCHTIPVLHKMGDTWLTSVGLASVVVGLAAQNTLGNLIAGVSLVLYRPFKIGDHLQVTAPGGQETGVVESVNLGYTVLRTADERRLLIPNSLMASQTCINLGLTDQRAACVITIPLQHEADADLARKILIEAAKLNPRTMGEPVCRITSISRAGVALTLTAWTANSMNVADLKSDILEAAKKQFDLSGMRLPRDYNLDPSDMRKPEKEN